MGETRYLEATDRTLKCAWPALTRLPYAHNALLLAVEEHLYPPQSIVVRGQGEELQTWLARTSRYYAPRRMTLAIPSDATGLPGILADCRPGDGVIAYVCEGFQCAPPIGRLEDLEIALAKSGVKPDNG